MFDLSADVSTDLAILIAGIAISVVILGVKKTREQGGPFRTDIKYKPCQFCGTTTSPTVVYEGPLFSSTRLCLLCAFATDASPHNPHPTTQSNVEKETQTDG